MAQVSVRPKRAPGQGGPGGAQAAPPFRIAYVREVVDELRKVVWPTPQELYRYTMVVIFTVAVIAIFIGAVDYGVSTLAKPLYNVK